ncbi:conserved hypothetical protein [Echinococcus multilocularis]|uniref:Uncharacterized protein n=1 Tax=Echinococcus multilocularis TaxID=6211 RepID=A0A087W1K7_ECHMU|nr:conserved hypothetical protein [Echinococcus multilocularis]
MGGRESKSDSECDCCPECAAQHRFHPTREQRYRTRRLRHNASLHQQAGCHGHSLFNNPENIRVNLADELSLPSPEANENDLLKEKETKIEENLSSSNATVDFPSLKSSSPVEMPKQCSELSTKQAKIQAERPKFQRTSKQMNRRNVFFQGATPCGDENPYNSHTPRRTPWPTYLLQGVPQQHTSNEVGVISSTSVTDASSLCFEDSYRDFLPHECGRCITEQDMISLFEFEKLERECDAACMKRVPPMPKARRTKMIQWALAETTV